MSNNNNNNTGEVIASNNNNNTTTNNDKNDKKQQEPIDEEDDFWYSLVERVSEFLPSNEVMSWDKNAVKQSVLSLSAWDPTQARDFNAAFPYRLEVQFIFCSLFYFIYLCIDSFHFAQSIKIFQFFSFFSSKKI